MKVTYPITLSHHGSYKHFNKQTLRVKEWIEEQWKIISSCFTLPPEFEIRLRPLPKRSSNGCRKSSRIEVDVSRGFRDIIRTLCHELTHEEQYFQGRLSDVGGSICEWNGEQIKRANSKRDWEAYRALPWEVEARERADEALAAIEKHFGTELPNDAI